MATYFRPPAGITDFDLSAKTAELKQAWHDYIGGTIHGRDGDLFYDPSNDPTPGTTPAKKPIPWNGFPNSIWRWFNADADPAGQAKAFAAADTLRPFFYYRRGGDTRIGWWKPGRPAMRRFENGALGADVIPSHRQQDEYCEWHSHRAGGRTTRITFTAEGPEYWEKMAEKDLDLVARLYREHVDPGVQAPDLVWPYDVYVFDFDSQQYVGPLFRKDAYNRFNKWNTTHGAMHLTHPANTLGAEINLAADATVLRPAVNQQPADTHAERLICCAGYGGVNRSSDPLIGKAVNDLARGGNAITLAGPVGLYIGTVGIGGLRDPAGVPIPQALRVRRASADGTMILRAEVVVPQGASYSLDQCTFDQRPLQYGGQIARKISLFLNGLAKPIPGRVGRQAQCGSRCCANPSAPDFKLPIGAAEQCSDLQPADWAESAPATPTDAQPGPGAPLTAAAASLEALAHRPASHVTQRVALPPPSRAPR